MPTPSKYSPCVGIRTCSDYSPFGVELDGRTVSGGYRFGFQNQEKDDEVKGNGNSVNYTFRMHDARLGRFFNVDPLTSKFPWNSSYAFSENRLLDGIEFEGLEVWKLSNQNTYMETFFGPFNLEYINQKQEKIDHYQSIREKTAAVFTKLEYDHVSNLSPYPMSHSPYLINSVPIEIYRDDDVIASFAITETDKIIIYSRLDYKDESFQIAVFAHEYAAHYLEGILDLIERTKNYSTLVSEVNPKYNPSLPQSANNQINVSRSKLIGSLDLTKEEVNGWSLMKSLHDYGYIQLNALDYQFTNDKIGDYETKLVKINAQKKLEENAQKN